METEYSDVWDRWNTRTTPKSCQTTTSSSSFPTKITKKWRKSATLLNINLLLNEVLKKYTSLQNPSDRDLAAGIHKPMTSRLITASHSCQDWKLHPVKRTPTAAKAAASLLSNTSHCECIILAHWSLQKLPHDFRVQVEVISTVLKTLCGTGLRYLRDLHSLCSDDLFWQLCSLGTMKLSAKGRSSAMQKN